MFYLSMFFIANYRNPDSNWLEQEHLFTKLKIPMIRQATFKGRLFEWLHSIEKTLSEPTSSLSHSWC